MRGYPPAVRLLLATVLVLVPLVFPHFYLLLATEVLIMGLFAVAFNLLLGYTGMVSFGHAAFYGLGAYACGLLLKKAGAPFAVAFLAAPILAAAAALIFGLLCIRLTRIYFSMLTLAFSQIVWAVAHKWYSLTGGDNGLVPIPVPEALAGPRAFYLFTLACTGLAAAALWRLVNAPFGRTLVGIKESESRMRTLGYNVWLHKYICFVIASFFGGVSGVLFIFYNGFISPPTLEVTSNMETLLMVALGGPGTIIGPFIGAFVIILLKNFVSVYTGRWLFILGAIYVLTILYAPKGLLELARWRGRTSAKKPAGPGSGGGGA